MTPRERAEAAGQWLAGAGGQATPGEIGAAFGLNHARQADVINDLVARDFAERAGRFVVLTPAGWARFSGVGPGNAGEVLDRVLAGWPVPHRALLELMVCAIIARHHLGLVRPDDPHLGFVAIGETATGKSAMGRLAGHLFGLDRAVITVDLRRETPGSLLGRRLREGDGFRYIPALRNLQPFVLLDEFDKGNSALRREAYAYLQGECRVFAEDVLHELRPTPLLTANPPAKGDRLGVVGQEYRRRSVVLDTGDQLGRGRELGQMLRAFYATSGPGDRLALDRLVPPTHLSADAVHVLDAIPESLTEEGRAEFDPRPLEMAALGRCALLGPDADHVGAAIQTEIAYMYATATVPGLVLPGWGYDVAEIRRYFGAGGQADQIAAAIHRGRQAADAQRDVVRATRRRKAHVDLQITEKAAALQEELHQVCRVIDGRSLPDQYKSVAAGLRARLKKLGAQAGRVGTVTTLEDVAAAAAEPMARARALAGEAAAAQALADRHRAEAAAAAAAEKQRAKSAARELAQRQHQHRRALQAQRRALLTDVRRQARDLEQLWARRTTNEGENPLRVLGQRHTLDGRPLLSYQAPEPEPPAKSIRVRVGRMLTLVQGTWSTSDGGLTFRGTATKCPALSTWGPNTCAVLATPIAHLHQFEDELCEQLAARRRGGRPSVSPGQLGTAGAPARAALPSAPTAAPAYLAPQVAGAWTVTGLNAG